MSDFADYRSCAMISMRPNQSLQPTAGRLRGKYEVRIMKYEVKARLVVASGGSAPSR
jgi:hypothetical protein